MAITKRLSTKPLSLRPPKGPPSSGLRGGAYGAPHINKNRDDITQVAAYTPGIKGKTIDKMDGAWVTSPLPLDADAKLRLQIKDIDRNRTIQLLRDWGYEPVCVSVLPRICSTGLIGACLYEIDLPRERQPIPQDDRAIPKDEIKNPEVEKMLAVVSGKQK